MQTSVNPTRRPAQAGFGVVPYVALVNERNEIGEAPARRQISVDLPEVGDALSTSVGRELKFPEASFATAGPSTCPACGSADLFWGCDPEHQRRSRFEIHPLVWHDEEWMADTYICRACDAGWIEPDDPAPITWVRPYWLV